MSTYKFNEILAMKNILLFSLLLISCTYGYGQTLMWSDDFENTAADWDLNVTPTGGFNASESNIWKISDDEGGVVPPGCGVASNGDKTLHVTCQGALCVGTGAVYFAGDAGFGLGPSDTDKRAKLMTGINTTGVSNLEVRFDWIGVGQAGQDFAVFEYSTDGGTVWNPIWTQTEGEVCGTGQGKWAEASVMLPAGADNIADLRFAFRWKNDNDGDGTDPSFAVNNLRLYHDGSVPDPTGPTANFVTPSQVICEGDCIKFTDTSTGDNITAWNWSFPGSDTPTSTDQSPANICFQTAGVYTVTLEVTDDNGTDTQTMQITVNDCNNPDLPVADFNTPAFTICTDDCIGFTDSSTGPGIDTWAWTFNGGTPATSNMQNPTSVCYDTPGTYNITLTVTSPEGSNSIVKQLVVQDCAGAPTAMFSADTTKVCAQDCISFTDESIGNPTSWYWEFEGANPEFSVLENPTNICYDSVGTFNVTLTVTNEYGTDQTVNAINVLKLPEIIGTGDTIIDMGGTAFLNANPIDPGELFWDPIDGLNCNVCEDVEASPLLTTEYYPSLIGANGCIGRDTILVVVDFHDIIDVATAFSPNGDGMNDVLHVLGLGIQKLDFRIFNRYGKLVFETKNIERGWDGTLNGKPLNQGVFFWTLNYTLVDGTQKKKTGNVTLIK